VLFASVVGAFFLVTQLNRRLEKRNTAILCTLFGLVFWMLPFALWSQNIWPPIGGWTSTLILYGFGFFAAMFSITVMITGSSMMADVVEASEIETGRRSEGLFFAGGLFMQKCATGLGIGLSGLIVSLSALPAKATPGAVGDAVLTAMVMLYCGLIMALAIASALAFARFPISRADHNERLKQLALASSRIGD
jgi:glycoside/pentoside/hexuronide:cation symporter, GPH family